MSLNTTPDNKPKLLVLLMFFIGFGVMASGVAQATEVLNGVSTQQRVLSESKFDLAATLRSWQPEFIVGKDGQGLNLAQPFGIRGPTLRLSKSMPDNVKRCLRAGGDHQIGAFGADNPDAYMFLEKRW